MLRQKCKICYDKNVKYAITKMKIMLRQKCKICYNINEKYATTEM